MALSDVFSIDQNYPTANFLKVPGSNPSRYTVFIYKFSDWVIGNQSSFFAVAQSAVNSDGTWKGVLDSITQTYAPITLTETEVDGTPATPYTIVAIKRNVGIRGVQTNDTIVLGLQIAAPIPTPDEGPPILPTIVVTGDYNALITDCVIYVNTATTALIILPTTGLVDGQFFIVKTLNTGVITVQGQTGTTDGNPSVSFHDQYASITFNYDGTNFWIT